MVARDEFAFENIVFTNSSVARRFEFENLEPSYVNCANWVGFIVKDSHSSDGVLTFNLKLFVDLTFGTGGDRIGSSLGIRPIDRIESVDSRALDFQVFGIDVPADPDGEFVVKARVSAAGEATQEQDFIAAGDDGVGNDLLPQWVALGVVALDEEAALAHDGLEVDRVLRGFRGGADGDDPVRIAVGKELPPGDNKDEFHSAGLEE